MTRRPQGDTRGIGLLSGRCGMMVLGFWTVEQERGGVGTRESARSRLRRKVFVVILGEASPGGCTFDPRPALA